jgi:non-reducing end alpha-L-arabinofuranosidase
MRCSGIVNRIGILSVAVGLITILTGISNAAQCPCDIYATEGTPCVAAHSTVRALYSTYSSHLYQVKRTADGQKKDIDVLTPGGFANAAAQDSFLNGNAGTISVIYDQSGKGNDLTSAPGGGAVKTADKEVNASKSTLMVNGKKVYAAYFEGGMGYRNNKTTSIAKGDEPEGMYMVTNGKHMNSLCCFDYGNAETTNNDDGAGTMEAIYFGNQSTYWGWGNMTKNTDGSVGPWVEADMENGLFAGNLFGEFKANTAVPYTYVTAMIKGKPNQFAIKAGNANSGTLTTMYEGVRPTFTDGKYKWNPMRLQGAIILGIGGDNSNGSQGTFYEGAMTTGYPSSATDEAIQANIIAAGYGSSTTAVFTKSAKSIMSSCVKIDCSNSILKLDFTAFSDGVASVKLFNLKGDLVLAKELQTNFGQTYSHSLDLSNVSNGSYIVHVGNGNNAIYTSRILLAK